MADVITRFKLETTQYDSKLRDAAKGLKEISHMAELGGKGFKEFTQNQVEAARAFGQTASGANNLKDKVKDLVGSFNDAAKAYNALTKEQQQTDFGKALAESLTTLKGRISEAKQELYGLADAAEKVKSSGGGGGLFGEGGLTGMLQVAGGNLIASGLAKIGSQMAETVQQSVELAKSGEGVRNAFERLNRPGLLDNLKEATHGTVSELELMKAAVKFDDFKLPVEQLGTLLEFAQKKAKDTGQSVDYMVDSIVTGLGRKSLMILDNLGLSASQVKEKMAETGDMTTAVAAIIKEQMSEAGEYVETAADRAARAAADASNQMEELGRKAMPVAEEWAKAWNEISLGGMTLLNTVLGPIADSIRSIREALNGEFKFKSDIPNLANGPVSPWAGWKPGTDHTVQAQGGYVEVTDKHTGKVIGGKHFDNLNDANAISDWQKSLVKTGGSKSKSKAPTANSFTDFITKMGLGADSMKPESLGPSDVWKAYTEDIRSGLQGVDTEMTNLTQWTKNFDALGEALKKESTIAKQMATAQNLAAESVSNLGAALASIDDPGAKAAGTVLQAIASIALGFAQASATAGTLGPFGWLAWLGAGTAALATTISTVHSLTGYAEGGVIKGNSFSGDSLLAQGPDGGMVGLNAGEVVLNRAQAGVLASAIQDNGGGNGRIVGVLRGEDIALVADRWGRRTGKGELAFFK